MPSPITGSDFDIQNFSGDVCEQLRKLLELNNTLKTFFEWMFNDDGTLTNDFKILQARILPAARSGRSGRCFTRYRLAVRAVFKPVSRLWVDATVRKRLKQKIHGDVNGIPRAATIREWAHPPAGRSSVRDVVVCAAEGL